MAKNKTVYLCRECGYDSVKWNGRCPGCGAWNSFEEELISTRTKQNKLSKEIYAPKPQPINEVSVKDVDRMVIGSSELDTILGGGIVPGSLILVGGEPGIGKSTLLMQVAFGIGAKFGQVLYVSGEESAHQVRMRAERLGALSPRVLVLTENNLEQIIYHAREVKPVLMIIDSIQTVFFPEMTSSPGSVSQVRQCTVELMRFSKESNVPLFLVGHVTKEGTLAGPRVLEHMVDTVLSFEGERHHTFRLLRATKNRFGSTNEIAVFDMQSKGLIPLNNPSQLFLEQRTQQTAGSVVTCAIQGTRPILLEVQALTAATAFGNPRRLTSGVDYNRTLLMIAVLDKLVGIHLSGQDVYINLAGGIKVEDPALDLAVAAAAASSFRDRKIASETVIIGEIGLGGEVRAVTNLEKRLKEAEKMGFTRAVIPQANSVLGEYRIKLIKVANIQECLAMVMD